MRRPIQIKEEKCTMLFKICPQNNKIYLIYGNLSDEFITRDLQRYSFRFLLNRYLRQLGYERIVFYSVANRTGKYVLDAESARYAINSNKQHTDPTPAAPQRARILNPRTGGSRMTRPAAQPPQGGEPPAGESGRLIYKQPKITGIQFRDEAAKLMANNTVKTAIVFPNFRDFAADEESLMRQYSELFANWNEYTSMSSGLSNDNICIFLAGYDGQNTFDDFLRTLPSGGIFRSLFFNQDGKQLNPSCTLEIGLPERDEIFHLLEALRVAGYQGRHIQYDYKSRDKLISLILYWSRKIELEAKGSGNLKSMDHVLTQYMTQAKLRNGKKISLDLETAKKLFTVKEYEDTDDPLQTLMNTAGWETAASRIDAIVRDHRRKKAEYEKKANEEGPTEKSACINSRLDKSDSGTGFQYPVPSFVLKGNAGTGKTSVARLIGRIFYNEGILENGFTLEVSRKDLVGGYVGQTAALTHERVMQAQGGILFVDEAYSLATGGENDFGQEAVNELVAAMTNPSCNHFCLILAGYPEKMNQLLAMNVGLPGRFSLPNILTIDDQPPELLQKIFLERCKKNKCRLPDPETDGAALQIEKFFRNLHHYGHEKPEFENARLAVTIANEAAMKAHNRSGEEIPCIEQADFGVYQEYFSMDYSWYEQETGEKTEKLDSILAELNEMIGLENVKREVANLAKTQIIMQKRKALGLKTTRPAMHMVFSGSPGTGKTTVARLIGRIYKQLGLLEKGQLIETDKSGLVGSYIGHTEEKVVKVVQSALGGVLFVDEAYSLAEGGEGDFGKAAIDVLVKQMEDNRENLAVIVAGYQDRMERFLNENEGLRSRFHTVIRFDDYSPEELVQIFSSYCKKTDYLLSKPAEAKLTEFFQKAGPRAIGNGRGARNLFEQVVKCQSSRLEQCAKLDVETMITILEEDVENAVLIEREKLCK